VVFFISDDHTRVRLRSESSSNGSATVNNDDTDEYLNANFVDGFRQPRAYIATQGPIQGTFCAFWKMVWEQNTQVIVMITHLFENGKVCENNFAVVDCKRNDVVVQNDGSFHRGGCLRELHLVDGDDKMASILILSAEM
jgi:protein tyrosine phosphatase